MTIRGTLHEVLTVPNPVLGLGFQPDGPVTKNEDYAQLTEDCISLWSDFTYQNISAAYGHLFGIQPVVSEAINLRGSPAEIRNEPSVDKVVMKWNHEICRHPLKLGAAQVQTALGLPLIDITMSYQEEYSRDKTTDRKPYIPDWCILQRDGSRSVLVWGESKCSSKWTTAAGTTQQRNNWIWPFRQVATYCINNNTRYAYILTPEEIVAVRVIAALPGSRNHCTLQIRSIPWQNSGPGQLTVNLTIWALAMMAVNEGHRPIRPVEWNYPLNLWWQDQSSFQHHLSGYVVSRLPAGAVAQPRPQHLPPSYDVRAAAAGSRSTRRTRR